MKTREQNTADKLAFEARQQRELNALAATIQLNDMWVGEKLTFGDYTVTRVIGGWLFDTGYAVAFVPLPNNIEIAGG